MIHNPRNRKILNDAKRLNPILEQSENMKKLLQSEDIISSRQQAPYPKHWLTNKTILFVNRCGDPRCDKCAYIEERNIILLISGMDIHAYTSMNCKSEYVI